MAVLCVRESVVRGRTVRLICGSFVLRIDLQFHIHRELRKLIVQGEVAIKVEELFRWVLELDLDTGAVNNVVVSARLKANHF